MKKIKLLFAAMLSMMAWTGVMATVTQPTMTTDPSNPVLYTIKNFRTGKYATYIGASTQLSQDAAITKAGLWYFEENGAGVSIIPAKDPSVKLVSHSSANATGSVWYLVENPYRAGYFCVTLSNNASSSCWDDQEQQTKIGYWQPSSSDNQGTSWSIEPFDMTTPIEVTYELYVGETKSSSTTVLQEANSEVAIPASMIGMSYNGGYQPKAYYTYTPEGTIGDEDCTIRVTRTETPGVVHALTDLSNAKSYTIACDRGSLLTSNGTIASTSHANFHNAAPAKFAVLSYEDHYYLYSVADKKFVQNTGSLSDMPTNETFDAIIMTAQKDPYFLFTFKIDDGETEGGKSQGLNTNGTGALNGCVINDWTTPDQGDQYYMIEAADFDATDALAALEAQFHPACYATYVVKDEAGNTLFTSEPQPVAPGANITAPPADFQRPYYTYNNPDVTITELQTTIEFTATWAGPFKISADFDNAQWQNMAIRSTWYVTSGNKDGDGAYKTVNANATGLVTDAYKWAFIGNGYDGFKLINKAEGDGKSFGWTDATAVNAGIPTIMDDAEGHHAWNIVPSTDTSVPANSFCLNVAGTDLYINQYGGAGGSLKFWKSGNNIGDPGSAFTIFDVPTNFAEFTADIKAALTDEATGYFTYNTETKALWKDEYATECDYDTYVMLKEAFDNLNNINWPETGYYILKNKSYGTYMGIDPSDLNMYGNYASANLPKQIVKLTKTGDKTYTISLEGVYAPATVEQSKAVTATAEAGTYTVSIPTYGYAAFMANPGSQYSALHCNTQGVLVGWEIAAASSQWEVLPAESIDIVIGSAGYATMYVPFAVAISSGVEAYVGKINGDYLDLTPVTGTIPAGTAVILEGEAKTHTFNITDDVDALENDLKGTYVAKEAEGGELTLQNVDGVGFYAFSGTTLGANKAYLTLPASSDVKSLQIRFGGEDAIQTVKAGNEQNVIFDLAGRRVQQAQKGVYIVNGRKVIR